MVTALRYAALSCALMLLGIGAALAEGLTADEARRFLQVSKNSEVLFGRGYDRSLMQIDLARLDLDAPPFVKRDFLPFSSVVAKLQATKPTAVSRLESRARAMAFNDLEDWVATGDEVTLAYLALTMPDIANRTPVSRWRMLMMAEDKRVKVHAANAVIEALNSVPQSHKKAVRPLLPLLRGDVAPQSNDVEVIRSKRTRGSKNHGVVREPPK